VGAFVASVGFQGTPALDTGAAIGFLLRATWGHESWTSDAFQFSRSTFDACQENAVPQFAPIDGIWCVADARLDNRDELQMALRLATGARPVSDAELICAAYRAWGDSSPDRLRGDFSFVVWDSRVSRLFGAVDCFGMRSLIFSRSGNRLLVGSQADAVAACLPTSPVFNTQALKAYLDGDSTRCHTETAFEQVHRVRPGFFLSASVNGTVTERFCQPGATFLESYRSEGDYIERFRELLDRSVRARLRATSPVSVMLSGGLDSSSVASLAARACAAKGAGLRAVSLVFPSTPEQDESKYQEAVVEAYPNLVREAIDAEQHWMYRDLGDAHGGPTGDVAPSLRYRSVFQAIFTSAAQGGSNVILTGHYSDQILGSRVGPVLLADLPVSQWSTELLRLWSAWGKSAPLWAAARALRLRYAKRQDWRALGGLVHPGQVSHSLEAAWHGVFAGGPLLKRQWLVGAAARHGVELRYPFLDRDLVEFVFALPLALRIKGDRRLHKYILREAMRGIVPETVRDSRHWTTFGHIVKAGWRRERQAIEKLLRDSHALQLGLTERLHLPALDATEPMFYRSKIVLDRFLEVEMFLRYCRAKKLAG